MGELRSERHRRNVATARQRIGRFDWAGKVAVEVFRIVAAKTTGRVGQHRLWMNHALVQSERVDERLQRGTWRAATPRAIDLAGDRLIEKVGGARLRENLHGSEI